MSGGNTIVTKSSPRRPAARASRLRGNSRRPGDFPIVGIGASAGGLEACRKFVAALPSQTGMAFIVVQHLDPNHESMMVDLLADHTSLAVLQATDGRRIERDHIYLIPPGTSLSVVGGMLHLSQPEMRHGARMPFDFLLHSLAEECGALAIGVVLSGTGADGSLGLKAVKEKGGLVVAQDPDEAGYDSMPRNAIVTGAVDFVLPVAKIPEALIRLRQGERQRRAAGSPAEKAPDALSGIIELLRTKTAHDFTLYKPGTLQRRIERRIAMGAVEPNDMSRYLEILRKDPAELDLLAKDLLINVTSFFRDPKVFEYLAEKIIPDLVADAPPERPLRIWIAGCSTGEETYSLAMLFREAIAAAKSSVKLQVFASDVDADAVAIAREGLYPESIKAAGFAGATRQLLLEGGSRLPGIAGSAGHGGVHRAGSARRSAVLAARHGFVPQPAHLSRTGGAGQGDRPVQLRAARKWHPAARRRRDGRRHAMVSSPSQNRSGSIGMSAAAGRAISSLLYGPRDGVRVSPRPGSLQLPSRQAVLAELCRRLVLESYAPAAVLINRMHEILYSLGRTERFLSVAEGHPTQDLLALARREIRPKLRAAIQQAVQSNGRVVLTGGHVAHDDPGVSFSIDVRPVQSDGEELLLVCFVDEPTEPARAGAVQPRRATSRRSPGCNASSMPPGSSCRAPSAISRFRAKSRRRSTRRRCRSTRNSSRPTRSCLHRRRNCSR